MTVSSFFQQRAVKLHAPTQPWRHILCPYSELGSSQPTGKLDAKATAVIIDAVSRALLLGDAIDCCGPSVTAIVVWALTCPGRTSLGCGFMT